MKIDAHNHIGKKKGVSVSVDDFIKSMDEAGIDKAVVFSFSEQIDNDYVIESVKRYPNRLFGFVTINPWSTTSEEDLEKAFSTDEIYGLKLHPVKHAYALDDHSLLDPLFKICEKHNKPILIFGGANVYSSPNMFAEMAIVYGNRYRVLSDEINKNLTYCELLFYKGDYQKSLELSINTLNKVEPGIYNKLLSFYEK